MLLMHIVIVITPSLLIIIIIIIEGLSLLLISRMSFIQIIVLLM